MLYFPAYGFPYDLIRHIAWKEGFGAKSGNSPKAGSGFARGSRFAAVLGRPPKRVFVFRSF
jgi:hypothetical protein